MTYITSVERRGIEKGIQQGMQQGIQQGMQQGIQQGMQQGIQQGMQQGIQQGRLDNAREDIMDILAARIEMVPDNELKAIGQIENITVLKHLLKRAALVGSLSEFTQLLSELGPDQAK